MLVRLAIAAAFGLVLYVRPDLGSGLALVALTVSLWPLALAWTHARGLTLRPAIAWGVLAVSLGIAAQLSAGNEPIAGGRPIAGHWAYLSSLATLAALISVLGARTPGGGAWAILMGMLVLVFLLPWLEGSGLSRGAGAMGRLRLDAPWSIFYALLIIAGVTNFLPTKFGVTAVVLGASLVVELLGLTMTQWPPSRRAMCWSAGPGLLGVALCLGLRLRSEDAKSGDRLANLWLWFRDHWGVVWALRVRERFNRAAEGASWPVRLAWPGPVAPDGGKADAIPEAAVQTLAALLKRFAEPSRIEDATGLAASVACPEATHQG